MKKKVGVRWASVKKCVLSADLKEERVGETGSMIKV